MSKIQSESNSQRWGDWTPSGRSCDQYVKDTIWKQFTTEMKFMFQLPELWPICQRYNLKAIHNLDYSIFLPYFVVTNMSKIQSESNSQQAIGAFAAGEGCDQYVKDTIWKQFTTWLYGISPISALWPICQRYNLKAIHNYSIVVIVTPFVVTNMSKIQSESNSQLAHYNPKGLLGCDQYVKDTIWTELFLRARRSQSNSQQEINSSTPADLSDC